MESTIKIGKTIKSFGKEGFIRLVIDEGFKNDLKDSYYILIEQEGYVIPYFIEEIDVEAGLVKFDEINGPEQTKSISDSDIYLLERHIKNPPRINTENSILSGFDLIDQNGNEVGVITDIIEIPMQQILVVKRSDQEILIPFHEDLLIEIDPEDKVIHLEIADGLLNI